MKDPADAIQEAPVRACASQVCKSARALDLPCARVLKLGSMSSDVDLAVQQPYSTLGVKAAVEMQKFRTQDPQTLVSPNPLPSQRER